MLMLTCLRERAMSGEVDDVGSGRSKCGGSMIGPRTEKAWSQAQEYESHFLADISQFDKQYCISMDLTSKVSTILIK